MADMVYPTERFFYTAVATPDVHAEAGTTRPHYTNAVLGAAMSVHGRERIINSDTIYRTECFLCLNCCGNRQTTGVLLQFGEPLMMTCLFVSVLVSKSSGIRVKGGGRQRVSVRQNRVGGTNR